MHLYPGVSAAQKASERRPGSSLHNPPLDEPARKRASWVTNTANTWEGPAFSDPTEASVTGMEGLCPAWTPAQRQAGLGGVCTLHHKWQLCALKLQDQCHLEQQSLSTASALFFFLLVAFPVFGAGLCYSWFPVHSILMADLLGSRSAMCFRELIEI